MSPVIFLVNPPRFTIPSFRYWRVRTTVASIGGYLDLGTSGQCIIAESTDLTGTNLGSALSWGSTIGMGNPSGVALGSGSGNPFNSWADRRYESDSSYPNLSINFDFGSEKAVHSLKIVTVVGQFRVFREAKLQHSSDGSVFVDYATLTNSSSYETAYWRSITEGSTIAATNS